MPANGTETAPLAYGTKPWLQPFDTLEVTVPANRSRVKASSRTALRGIIHGGWHPADEPVAFERIVA
jgi:hypothetical protein